MANPISTSGVSSGMVSTQYQSGQSTRDWVTAHNTALDNESPAGDELSTEWVSQAGAEKIVTLRGEDEVDATFMARHKAEYLLEMLEAPPVP